MGATLCQRGGRGENDTEKVRGDGPNANRDSSKCFQDDSVFLNGLSLDWRSWAC